MKTTLATKTDHSKSWFIVDAANETLGRISVKIANVLRGRHKPTYTPQTDTGDFVVVVNAEKINVTGKKNTDLKKPLPIIFLFNITAVKTEKKIIKPT